MKKLVFSLMALIAAFTTFAQEDIPLDATIDFVQFDKAVKGVEVDGYVCTTTAEDPTVYSALFTLNELNGALTAFHVSFYNLITSGNDEFIPVKELQDLRKNKQEEADILIKEDEKKELKSSPRPATPTAFWQRWRPEPTPSTAASRIFPRAWRRRTFP